MEYAERAATETVSIDVRSISVLRVRVATPPPPVPYPFLNPQLPRTTSSWIVHIYDQQNLLVPSQFNSPRIRLPQTYCILASEDFSLATITAISTLDSTGPMLDAARFEKIVYEDFYDVFVGLIRSIGEPDAIGKVLTLEDLLEASQNSEGQTDSLRAPYTDSCGVAR